MADDKPIIMTNADLSKLLVGSTLEQFDFSDDCLTMKILGVVYMVRPNVMSVRDSDDQPYLSLSKMAPVTRVEECVINLEKKRRA